MRWTWILLNYALAGDILYRSAFLRQDLAQYGDFLFIWLGTLAFYIVTQLSMSGFAVMAAEGAFLPTVVLGIAVGGAAILSLRAWNAWIVVSGVSMVVFFATLAMLVIRRRNPLT